MQNEYTLGKSCLCLWRATSRPAILSIYKGKLSKECDRQIYKLIMILNTSN